MTRTAQIRGPLAWMARNSVVANLLMLVLIGGGLLSASRVQQEVFPEIELDIVQVAVPYPQASPVEVEEGILVAVEEAVRGLDGIKRVTSTAFEDRGAISIELLRGTNANKALQDIKSAIDRITSFPEDSERPVVSLVTNRRAVISLILYGDLDEHTLRALGERAREALLRRPEITQVELSGVPAPEIAVEIPQSTLRAYDLTLGDVARRVAQNALDLPGGGVKTGGGEILLRTAERRDVGREFSNIGLLSNSEGMEVRLGDIARITDGFADTDERTLFNGKPAVRIDVFRVGTQTPTAVADAVRDYAREVPTAMGPTVGVATWGDRSQMLSERLGLLLRNASLGLVLVLLILGLFLQPDLAGWVTLGIPVSVLGGLFVMPMLGVSLNMLTLFAFILTLGIIVDDAIVVSENIYEIRRHGAPGLNAAIEGVRGVAVPVTFSVLTNIAAFVPLLVTPGIMGKFFRVMPMVVIPVFLFSLIESLFVLPAHLGHQRPLPEHGVLAFLSHRQQRVADALERFVREKYGPWLRAAVRYRYLTAAISFAVLILIAGLVAGGRIDLSLLPRVDSDVVTASAVLPYGTPVEQTEAVEKQLLDGARHVLREHGGEAISRGIFAQIGRALPGFSSSRRILAQSGSHLTEVQAYLVPSDQRAVSASEFARFWRERVGEIAGVETLAFIYTTGPNTEAAINIELSHPDMKTLQSAATALARMLNTFAGVTDIDAGFLLGKPQLDFQIRPEGRSFGVTAADLGRQIRDSFYGAEAIRQQRGRDEIKVMVRLPKSERRSQYDVERLLLRIPGGGEIPLLDAAEVRRGRAYTEIKRADGRRVVNVTGDVIEGVANAGKVVATLKRDVLPGLVGRYPGLRYSFEGGQRERRESMRSLMHGFMIALLAIFVLLAIPFRSYAQPFIVMTAIPFGLVGAVIGHLIMGLDLSISSMMGLVALSGVVVNDSLVLMDAANQRSRAGAEPVDAIVNAAMRRFRPILLTSLTTFFGLLPMIFESSVQARFLIPMAVSLGYGILFSTFTVLLVVPALYLIMDDARRRLHVRRQETA